MNSKSILFVCAALLQLLLAAPAIAQSTAFNYQGRLIDGTTAASGIYDLRFAIYDASTNGNAAAEPVIQNAIEVRSGLFNVTLDFGPAVFTGSNRWLEISVRTNGDSNFTTLRPRQPLLPTPYAITAANLSGTLGATQLNGVLPSSALAGDYNAILNFNNESNHYAGDGTALKFGGFGYCALPCYWNLNGNAGTAGQNFIGTTDNTPLEFRVNGQRALRLEPTTNSPNVIGGFEGNSVESAIVGSTIGGGGTADSPNRVIHRKDDFAAVPHFATISGGTGNTINGTAYGTIGGGAGNTVSKSFPWTIELDYDTIGGGFNNRIDQAANSTIGGGIFNSIHGDGGDRVYDSTIGGGNGNVIDGTEDSISQSTIAGGKGNQIVRASQATIGGGAGNYISVEAHGNSIGGGYGNSMGSGTSSGSISGGASNRIYNRAFGGSISGGKGNFVTGDYGSVLGGFQNVASSHAFAAGTRANAVHGGSFVWADAEDEDFASTGTNQFLIRASGGVGIGTTAPQAALHVKGDLIVEGAASIRFDTAGFSIGSNALATGVGALALGPNSTASGSNSIAFGQDSLAEGVSSAAIGQTVTARGYASAAFGTGTTANGDRSFATGQNTTTSGRFSTAMGWATAAEGDGSVAMGFSSRAVGHLSIAVGHTAIASGNSSVAMGNNTEAIGPNSTAMGEYSRASGLASTTMGYFTTASGDFSTALGNGSSATASNTVALGYHARAEDPGSFVWASGNTNVFPSSTSNRVHFYAAGGMAVEYAGQDQYGRGLKWLVLASQEPGKVINVYNGAYLSEGGAWTDTSDRNAKEKFEPVDSKEILERVTKLPLSSWSYRSESNSVRHLGPVAQDFHAAFGLGADDKHIAGLDTSGVALAAIQGLSQELKAKQTEIDQLKQRLEALERKLDGLSR